MGRWLMRLALAAAGIMAGEIALAYTEALPHGGPTLDAHELLRYLHIVLLVFWLGPDVAIVVAGSFAANPALNAAQRAGAARMMEYYEIMPRVCMSLMLTVGGLLSEHVGLAHPWWQMAGIWLLGPVWLGLTLAAYFGAAGAGTLAGRLERLLRMVLVVAVPASVAYSISTGRLAEAPYVGGKLLLFALILVLGLLAARAWAPFRDGVRRLAVEGTSAALDAQVTTSFRAGRRYVIGVWIALALAALSGVVQPGVVDPMP